MMRQRQSGLSGVENAATCMDGSCLPAAAAAPPISTTTTAAAPVPAAASAAARARGIRQLDLQRPAVHFLAIELLHRLGGLFGRRHLDEAEPARTAGVTVRYDRGRFDGAGSGEQLAQAFVGRGEGQPTDKEFLRHEQPPSTSPAT